jgi:hypothetical protein
MDKITLSFITQANRLIRRLTLPGKTGVLVYCLFKVCFARLILFIGGTPQPPAAKKERVWAVQEKSCEGKIFEVTFCVQATTLALRAPSVTCTQNVAERMRGGDTFHKL